MANNVIEGGLNAKGLRFGVVVSRFNSFISDRLLSGVYDCLQRNGAQEKDIKSFRVPGSFEVPLMAKHLAASGKYDAVICVGAVIRGSTPHFDYISAEMTKGIAQVMLDSGLPVSYGVITTDTLEQAIERAGSKSGNKGFDAAMAAIEMVNLMKAADAAK
jgi:6,7-dimethyl-8-ribityllumazine synthase